MRPRMRALISAAAIAAVALLAPAAGSAVEPAANVYRFDEAAAGIDRDVIEAGTPGQGFAGVTADGDGSSLAAVPGGVMLGLGLTIATALATAAVLRLAERPDGHDG